VKRERMRRITALNVTHGAPDCLSGCVEDARP
jgi:hypothetical protein